ncbi:MAG TPA: competence protein ComK [Bacilli bacterium]|nr:competence protein ComK [Bacilli bacterium]
MNDLLYIVDKRYNLIIHYEEYQTLVDTSLKKFLNELCLQEYTTLEGRIKAIKHLFNFKNNPPLYINQHIILVKVLTKDDIYWINVYNIVDIVKVNSCQTKIIFKDNSTLLINKDKNSVIKSFKKARLIINQRNCDK